MLLAGGAPMAECGEPDDSVGYAALAAKNHQVMSPSDCSTEKALDFPRVGFISLSSDLAQSSRVPSADNKQTQLIACLLECGADLAFCS